ncbi:MAG TPA: DUF4339 domain-containing protein [Tepidisphaeraceae bacterium]|jgi:hypothetical protein
MDEWHIQVAGKYIGATTAAQVVEWLENGTFDRGDLIWRQGMVDWEPLSTIAEFGGVPVPPLPEDSGPFLKVGTTFYLDGQEWVGRTVVSPAAFYLLKGRSLQGVRVSGNFVLSVIMTTVGMLTRNWSDIRTCSLAALPAGVRIELDPKGKRHPGTSVVIVRRTAVELVEVPRIYNVIRLLLGGRRVSVVTSWFGVRKVGRWLNEQGWILNQPLKPTEAPIHGSEFHRNQ